MENSEVVCRQLNKPGVNVASLQIVETHITSGDRICWLANVRCKGDEKRLLDCPRDTLEKVKSKRMSNWKVFFQCNQGKFISGLGEYIT